MFDAFADMEAENVSSCQWGAEQLCQAYKHGARTTIDMRGICFSSVCKGKNCPLSTFARAMPQFEISHDFTTPTLS